MANHREHKGHRIMMTFFKPALTAFRCCFWIILCLLLPLAAAENTQACFSIVAGKSTTEDGSVLLAHNEDNGPDDIAGMVKIERTPYRSGKWDILNDGVLPGHVTANHSYLCMQMPYNTYSDNVLNEFGVAVVSNYCPSREDWPEIIDGGIGGPILRHLVAQRARSAREGVQLAGALVERYGYTSSGRTMIICDPNEGWLVGLVKGKHWVAARVPDDQVAFLANTFSIHKVDLSDTKNFLGSPDLVDYAEKRGWYSSLEGSFDFEKAYALPAARLHAHNLYRQWSAMADNSIEKIPLPETQNLPFSIKPKLRLSVRKLFTVLRDHYDRSPLWPTGHDTDATPHNKPYTICNHTTNYSSIYQLRSHMPVEIGAVWWCALWAPCSSPYIPVYLGTDGLSLDLAVRTNQDRVAIGYGPAYGLFHSLRNWAHQDFAQRGPILQKKWRRLEEANFKLQAGLEEAAMAEWRLDKRLSKEMLTLFTMGALSRAMKQAALN